MSVQAQQSEKTSLGESSNLKTCPICLKTMHHCSIQRHLQTHQRTKQFPCPVCGMKFSRKDHLKNHEMRHIEGYVRPFQCPHCDKGYYFKTELKEHSVIHSEERPFQCEICEKSFKRKQGLREHTRTHSGEKNFTCDFCGKGYMNKKHLKSHILIHTEVKPVPHEGEQPFQCEICAKTFKERKGLRVHVSAHIRMKKSTRKVHAESYVDTPKKNLKSPVVVYIEEKTHTCNICNEVFAKASYLEAHMESHVAVKPINFGTNDERSCAASESKSHSSAEDFLCVICGKRFQNQIVFNVHLENHKKNPSKHHMNHLENDLHTHIKTEIDINEEEAIDTIHRNRRT